LRAKFEIRATNTQFPLSEMCSACQKSNILFTFIFLTHTVVLCSICTKVEVWYSIWHCLDDSILRLEALTISSKVAADWYELMIPQCTMQPSIAHVSKNWTCSLQSAASRPLQSLLWFFTL